MLNLHFSSATLAALGAALLFGGSTPFAKQLVGDVPPLLLAGFLYFGSGSVLSYSFLLCADLEQLEQGLIFQLRRSWARVLPYYFFMNLHHFHFGQRLF